MTNCKKMPKELSDALERLLPTWCQTAGDTSGDARADLHNLIRDAVNTINDANALLWRLDDWEKM